MIRNLLTVLIFFFGPVVLLFMLRHLGLLLRFWLMARRMRGDKQADVIDITPQRPQPPSLVFIMIALSVGLAVAWLAWMRLSDEPDVGKRYVPAYIDEQGKVVPGHHE